MGNLFDDEMASKALSMELDIKIEKALEQIRKYEDHALEVDPENGYHLCFSGGKDSVVLLRLAEMAGVKFGAWYSQTTIDPPELVRFIIDEHPEVQWIRPKKNFFTRLPERIPPTRRMRWCCREYKENGGVGKVKMLGVRAAESPRRKQQWRSWTPWKDGQWCLLPMLYWTDKDIWDFIQQEKVSYCSLYDEGFKRLGCIGCPLAGDGKYKEFARWPRFEKLWKRAIYRWWEAHQGKLTKQGKLYKLSLFKTPEGLWQWWLTSGRYKEDLNGAARELEKEQEGDDECTMGLF